MGQEKVEMQKKAGEQRSLEFGIHFAKPARHQGNLPRSEFFFLPPTRGNAHNDSHRVPFGLSPDGFIGILRGLPASA